MGESQEHRDWMEFGIHVLERETARVRGATINMARFIARLEPAPPGAITAAVVMLRDAHGWELSRALQEYRQIKAEVRREQLAVVSPSGSGK